MSFHPDFNNILKVLYNQRPDYLPLYEHHINTSFIAKAIDKELDINSCKSAKEYEAYFSTLCDFWKDNTYDAMSFEAAICPIFPGHGAIFGGVQGSIQTRDDFEKYPWESLPQLFWEKYTPQLDALTNVMPKGMKAYGGCGYGVFEASQDLVGFENLCVLQYIDPELFTDLFLKIGDLYETLWKEMDRRYKDTFVFYRMGDDLGYKSSTMLEPDTIRTHILPQQKRIVDVAHASGKKFLLHSCGCIFDIMDDILKIGIDAKHSNEDQIAPYDTWIDKYGKKIGLFGGIDVNCLCLNTSEEVYSKVLTDGTRFRSMTGGYALGSGNSIPDYVPVDNFNAMVEAAKEIRRREKLN